MIFLNDKSDQQREILFIHMVLRIFATKEP